MKRPSLKLKVPKPKLGAIRANLTPNLTTINQWLIDIFHHARTASRWQWLKFIFFILIFFYFLGLAVVMAMAYQPQTFTKNQQIVPKLSRKDLFIKSAVIIYPLPAAVVNDEVIPMTDFYTQINYMKHFNSRVPNSLSKEITDEKSLRKRVLETLIDNRILRQEARKYKITVSDKDVEAAYNTATKENGGPKQVEKVLKELYGISPDEFKSLIRDLLYKEKISKTLLVQYHVKHILLTDKPKADATLARLQKGENFEAVAAEVSEDATTKKQGGEIGWFGRQELRDKIDPEFEKAATALNKGQLSAPVKTKYGYHIIRLDDKKGRIDKTYDDWFSEAKKKAKIMRLVKP